MTTTKQDERFPDKADFTITFGDTPMNQFGNFGKGYFLAAKQIAEHLVARSRFPDYEAYPVVFLYRHAFELYLKNIIYKAVPLAAFKEIGDMHSQIHITHDLKFLAGKVKTVLNVLFPDYSTEVKKKIQEVANEVSGIDPDSFSYRYPIDTTGKPPTPRNQIVNLRVFANSMNFLLKELESIDFGIDIETDRAQEICRLMQLAEAEEEQSVDAEEEFH